MDGRWFGFVPVKILVFLDFHLSHLEVDCSSSDDNTVAAGRGRDVLFLFIGGAAGVGLIIITTAGSTAVELDAITRAGDAVSLARAAQ